MWLTAYCEDWVVDNPPLHAMQSCVDTYLTQSNQDLGSAQFQRGAAQAGSSKQNVVGCAGKPAWKGRRSTRACWR